MGSQSRSVTEQIRDPIPILNDHTVHTEGSIDGDTESVTEQNRQNRP